MASFTLKLVLVCLLGGRFASGYEDNNVYPYEEDDDGDYYEVDYDSWSSNHHQNEIKSQFDDNEKYFKGNYPNNPNGNTFKGHQAEEQRSAAAHSIENPQAAVAGCRTAGLCCQGKDNNCVTKGPRINGSNNDTCYCDSTCLPLGDCCTDYTGHCREVGCVLSQWGDWSACDVPCGFGVRQRARAIIQEPRNGAQACNTTTQKQVCEGISCKKTRASGSGGEELRETARILPLKFGQWREAYKYDPLKDIRRNIYHHLGHNSTHRSQLAYCGLYRLNYVQPSCRINSKAPSSSPPPPEIQTNLDKGVKVCVECQHTAISDELGGRCYGHGVVSKVTKWTALEKGGCRGTWVLEERSQSCSCQQNHPNIRGYIFV